MAKKSEKGTTLLELIIGLGITVGIFSSATMAGTTLMLNYGEDAVQCDLLPAVENCGHWITQDVQVSRNVTASGPNGFPLSLSIPLNIDESNDNLAEYYFDGSKLKRRLYDSSHILLSDTYIAEYIDMDNTKFSAVNSTIGHYNLNVTASRGESFTTRNYDMSQWLLSD